jgi:hypothetical protein
MRFLFLTHAFILALVSLIVPWYQTKTSVPPPPPPANAVTTAAASVPNSDPSGKLSWADFFIWIGKSVRHFSYSNLDSMCYESL